MVKLSSHHLFFEIPYSAVPSGAFLMLMPL